MSESHPRSAGSGGPGRVDYIALMIRARHDRDMVELAARCILQEFDAYYSESRGIPERAKVAFEDRDPALSLRLSRRRLSIFSETIRALAAQLKRVFPLLAEDEHLWHRVEQHYHPMIRGRYEEDLALAYIHAARRMIFDDEWKPIEYGFGRHAGPGAVPVYVYRDFPGGASITAQTAAQILQIPDFTRIYHDLERDSRRVAARLNHQLGFDGRDPDVVRAIQVIDAGFYRNRGAYVVGRIVLRERSLIPLVIALENGPQGIFVDAVLTSEPDAHNIFSSTLANFHVTNSHYHELSRFLHSIMPGRALGLHYSTIGFNHVGKLAVTEELRGERAATHECFDTAVGFRGTVAIGFSAPSSAYVLKVIRDKPTAQYKWGHFEGIAAVLAKYRRVHEINRTGSMLDNMIFNNIKLDQAWFSPALRDDLVTHAAETVTRIGTSLVFKHLIVQPKMIPLPVFLENASAEDAATVVRNLGDCIKNNAAANIFNKDLDGRNYGVSRFLKVYLFDYDALEPFTDVKVRTNLDRIDGEEDIPDWFFEDGVIFLPEEIESGLRIPDRALRRLFRAAHGDLLTVDYWEDLQAALRQGRVPRISIYPEAARFGRDPASEAQDAAEVR